MTNQEAFDAVCEHLAQQKTQSLVLMEGHCAYRGDNGGKCAIGALIPDSEYNTTMECTSAAGLFSINTSDGRVLSYYQKFGGHSTKLAGVYLPLLSDLQRCHDQGANSAEELFRSLRIVANRYNLSAEKAEMITHWTNKPVLRD